MPVTIRPRRSDPRTREELKCWSLDPKTLIHATRARNVQKTVEVPTQKLLVHGSSFASAALRERNSFTGCVKVMTSVHHTHGSKLNPPGKPRMAQHAPMKTAMPIHCRSPRGSVTLPQT